MAAARACCRLHALVAELVAGGIRKEIVVTQAESLLADDRTRRPRAQRQRLELAHEILDEIRILDDELKRSKTRIATAVAASGTSLTDIYGVGPIIAAIIIGYTGDIAGSRPPVTSPPTTGPLRSSSAHPVAPCTDSRGAATAP